MIRFMGYSNARQDTRRRRGQTLLAPLRGTFLDDHGKEICGAYYVNVRRLDQIP